MNTADHPAGPVRWGILGVANIAIGQVIPALQQGPRHRVVAIASRDAAKAAAAAKRCGIPRSHGSYQAMIDDPDVEAIYNPLPNHLHVPWTIKAMEAGKHVLCEKPIAMSAAEAHTLLAVRQRTGVQVAEAFMVRAHPQWLHVHELVSSGTLGPVQLITGHFSYSRRDPADVRSRVEYGGGVLMDIGCYPIMLARWLFDEEPVEVMAMIERDPDLEVDHLTSGMLRFSSGQATFTVAGQLPLYQSIQVFCAKGRITVEIPFNTPANRPGRVMVDDGRDVLGGGVVTTEFPAVNQYTLQGDRIADAIRLGSPVPVDVEGAIGNMAVIDALFRSAETRRWEEPARERA